MLHGLLKICNSCYLNQEHFEQRHQKYPDYEQLQNAKQILEHIYKTCKIFSLKISGRICPIKSH